MNPSAHSRLLGLYAEWRRLSDLEGSAIRDGAWTEVERQQFLKKALRDEIVRTIQQWNAEHAAAESARADFEREFRPVVAGLIEQEQRNQDLLGLQRRDIESGLANAGQSASRLRNVHRTYSAPGSSRWQSYS